MLPPQPQVMNELDSTEFYVGSNLMRNAVPLIRSAEYNYQNTLRCFHFHTNTEFLKRMERQLLRLKLETGFRKAFW